MQRPAASGFETQIERSFSAQLRTEFVRDRKILRVLPGKRTVIQNQIDIFRGYPASAIAAEAASRTKS